MKVDNIWYEKDKGGDFGGNPCGEIEINSSDIKEKFITEMIKCFVESLRVSWKSRGLVEPLIHSAVYENIRNLLEQYFHHELEILAQTFNREFLINEKINFKYATHAKMSDIIEGNKKKIEKKVLIEKKGLVICKACGREFDPKKKTEGGCDRCSKKNVDKKGKGKGK